jgi:hypothetical protein
MPHQSSIGIPNHPQYVSIANIRRQQRFEKPSPRLGRSVVLFRHKPGIDPHQAQYVENLKRNRPIHTKQDALQNAHG